MPAFTFKVSLGFAYPACTMCWVDFFCTLNYWVLSLSARVMIFWLKCAILKNSWSTDWVAGLLVDMFQMPRRLRHNLKFAHLSRYLYRKSYPLATISLFVYYQPPNSENMFHILSFPKVILIYTSFDNKDSSIVYMLQLSLSLIRVPKLFVYTWKQYWQRNKHYNDSSWHPVTSWMTWETSAWVTFNCVYAANQFYPFIAACHFRFDPHNWAAVIKIDRSMSVPTPLYCYV